MSPIVISIIVMVVMIVLLIVLTIMGNRMQKKQNEQRELVKESAQMVSMLVIDKKMMKMKEAGLPKQVMENTPKRFRGAKLPIVKVKVGPQTMNMICDEAIFDDMPTKCEIKAMVSGIYITEIKSVRGKRKAQQEEPKKKSIGQKLRDKQRKLQSEMEYEEKTKEQKKKEKAENKKKAERASKIK